VGTGKEELTAIGDEACIGSFGAQSVHTPKQFPGRRFYLILLLAGTLSLTPWLQPGDDEGRVFLLTVLTICVIRNR